MLPASHLISHGVPGHGTSDGRCLRAFNVSPCSFCNNYKRFPQAKIMPSGILTCSSRGTMSFTCNANSSGQRRNPDFSRQGRQGFSRNKNRNNEDRDAVDGFEDSEVFSTKNGQPFLSGSPPKFQSTPTPGPREREIVEIFRKVQAQLRERAAQKEEKKVEDSQGHNKQNETVDSLLKLLRKHSVQQGKGTTTSRNNKDFMLDNQPEQNSSFTEDRSQKDSNNRVKNEVQTTEAQSTRPVSNFQKRSPVPTFKYKPVLTGEESFTPGPFKRKEARHEPESTPEVKVKTGPEPEAEIEAFAGFDESSDDDTEEVADEIDDDSEEATVIEDKDLSSMKLVELREVAKSRGIKGFSRLKKAELLELLSS
ncbi:hypothetical protein SSX86_026789 [Deinandra increscens subsp. villosa]|uniref:Rho termination factor-like N-terminal domain-containing protein n=1 Tax=Deinandra increscens subsp. villosa TaxID=3103831 RepID=A0AAP0CM18_9ASTR